MHNQNQIPHDHPSHSKLLFLNLVNQICIFTPQKTWIAPAGQSEISTQQEAQWLCRTPGSASGTRILGAVASMAAGIGVEYLVEAMPDISTQYI